MRGIFLRALIVFSVVLAMTKGAAAVSSTTTVNTLLETSSPGNYVGGGTDFAVTNPGFESDLSGWTVDQPAAIISSSVHSGSKAVKLGNNTIDGGSVRQTFTLPATTPIYLEFWSRLPADSFITGFAVVIYDTNGDRIADAYLNGTHSDDYIHATCDISRWAGQTITISFESREACITFFGCFATPEVYLDDIRIRTGSALYVPENSTAVLHPVVYYAGFTCMEPGYKQPYVTKWRLGNTDPFQDYNNTPIALPSTQGSVMVQYYSDFLAATGPPNPCGGGEFYHETFLTTNITVDARLPNELLSLAPPVSVSGGSENVVEGGFETTAGWSYVSASRVTGDAHSGTSSMYVGSSSAHCAQTVAIPANSDPLLTFWSKASSGDKANLLLWDLTAGDTVTLSIQGAGSWKATHLQLGQFAGHSLRIEFSGVFFGGTMRFDDVSLQTGELISVNDANSLTILSTDSASGVGSEFYTVDGGAAQTTQPIVLGTPGLHTLAYSARDNVGHVRTVSTQINVVPGTLSIPIAKLLSPGSPVTLQNKTVTAVFPGAGTTKFYIAEPGSPHTGILAHTTAAVTLAEGDSVTVTGTTHITAKELQINATGVTVNGAATPTAPYFLSNWELGGVPYGQQPGITGGKGPNTIGSLVRTAGKVTGFGPGGEFYIDDGSSLTNAVNSSLGIPVFPNGPIAIIEGDFAAATGICGILDQGGAADRAIYARSPADIVKL